MAFRKVVKKRRPRRFIGFVLLLVSAVGICVFFYGKKLSLDKEYRRLEAEKKRVEMMIRAEEKRAAELEDYRAYVQTKSYIEEVARNTLGLVYKNEVLFKAKASE